MPEFLIFGGLCFAVGYLSRPRLSIWWYYNHPARCSQCGKWSRWQNTESAQHRVAGWVRVCKNCYRLLYKPTGDAK